MVLRIIPAGCLQLDVLLEPMEGVQLESPVFIPNECFLCLSSISFQNYEYTDWGQYKVEVREMPHACQENDT